MASGCSPKGVVKKHSLYSKQPRDWGRGGGGEERGRGRERSEHGYSNEHSVIHLLSIIPWPHIHVTTKSYHQHTYIRNY